MHSGIVALSGAAARQRGAEGFDLVGSVLGPEDYTADSSVHRR